WIARGDRKAPLGADRAFCAGSAVGNATGKKAGNARLREVVVAAIGLSLLLVAMHRNGGHTHEASVVNGRFTEAQIIDRARAVCAVIGTQMTSTRWTAAAHKVWPHGGAMMPLWIVECYNESGA